MKSFLRSICEKCIFVMYINEKINYFNPKTVKVKQYFHVTKTMKTQIVILLLFKRHCEKQNKKRFQRFIFDIFVWR